MFDNHETQAGWGGRSLAYWPLLSSCEAARTEACARYSKDGIGFRLPCRINVRRVRYRNPCAGLGREAFGGWRSFTPA
jgi:hypothetical protein